MKEPAPWTEADQLKYEIEDYSSTTGKTGTSNRAAFSNGKGGEINQDGGTLIYDVTVPADGVYLMNIAYATGQRRWITVSANGGEAVPVGFLQTTVGVRTRVMRFITARCWFTCLKATM